MTLKRITDIAISAFALLMLAPILLLIVLVIKLESKGPVLYRAPRAGQGYRIFKLLKFRTMEVNADTKLKSLEHLNLYSGNAHNDENASTCNHPGEECVWIITKDGKYACEKATREINQSVAAFFKIKDDPRITRVGKFLRNTSLDELPQLFNVLKGDMSLVGNRPLPLYEAEKLTGDEAVLRFMAPAGITGLWQVTKRGRKGEMSEKERIELDKEYARDYSFIQDVKLIFKTIPALFQKENV